MNLTVFNAKSYNSWYSTPFGKYAHELEKNLLLSFLGVPKGKKILDVGCGTGIYSIESARLSAEVVGLDNSEEMLNFAKESIEKNNLSKLKVNFILGDAEKLPFEDNSFDIVIAVLSLCFIKNDRKALAEMRRVCKEKVVIAVLNRNSLYYFEKRKSSSYKNAKFYKIKDFNKENIARFKTTIFALSFFPKFLLKIFYKIDNFLSIFNFGAFLVFEIRK